MKYVVRKPFSGGGRDFASGEVVDLEGRNVSNLISQRFLEPAPPATPAPIAADHSASPRATRGPQRTTNKDSQ